MTIRLTEPQPPRDLGPKQIAWLIANVPAFASAHEAVEKMKQEIAANRAAMKQEAA